MSNKSKDSLSRPHNNFLQQYGSIQVTSFSNKDEDASKSHGTYQRLTAPVQEERYHDADDEEVQLHPDEILYIGRPRRRMPSTQCLVLTSLVASATCMTMLLFLALQNNRTAMDFPSAEFRLPLDDDVPEWTRHEMTMVSKNNEQRVNKASEVAKEALSRLNAIMSDNVTSSDTLPIYGSKRSHSQEETLTSATATRREREMAAAPPPVGCEATVMVMRHCEKDISVSQSHCNYVGFERAAYLPYLFASSATEPPNVPPDAEGNVTRLESKHGYNEEKEKMPEMGLLGVTESSTVPVARWPQPSYLYALSAKRHKRPVYREIETLQPLADKYNLTINSHYNPDTSDKLVHEVFSLLKSGTACGKLLVICWKHSEIPRLANLLGCGPTQGCPMDYLAMEFDQVWQLKFLYKNGLFGLPLHEDAEQKKKKNVLKAGKPEWKVFGSVQYQGFDPLEFSGQVGDYPLEGAGQGGRWIRPVEPQS